MFGLLRQPGGFEGFLTGPGPNGDGAHRAGDEVSATRWNPSGAFDDLTNVDALERDSIGEHLRNSVRN